MVAYPRCTARGPSWLRELSNAGGEVNVLPLRHKSLTLLALATLATIVFFRLMP